jgi:peptidoglycan/xylan/chitin deacetylase (PgdA/CDA1 family)
MCHDSEVAGFPLRLRVAGISFVLAVLAACTGTSVSHSTSPPPLQVRVDGVERSVEPGTTLGALVLEADLHATPGRLLAVDGSVLNRTAFPGRVELNGRSVRERRVLAIGDRIRVIDGKDKTEGTRRTVEDVGKRVGNPERTLSIYPTQQITVSGRLSGKIVSVSERSLGKGTTPREVALTFDDGPWPLTTKLVLQLLHRYSVPATFFMIGSLVQQHPRLVRMVRADGQEIGNHTFDHPLTMEHQTPEEVAAELRHASRALALAGVHSTLFRPPGGWYDDALVEVARRQGMRLVTWNVDPRDWRSHVTSKEIAHAVLSHVHAGSIVLLHDGGGNALHTIKALPAIIKGIRARDLRFVKVPARPV